MAVLRLGQMVSRGLLVLYCERIGASDGNDEGGRRGDTELALRVSTGWDVNSGPAMFRRNSDYTEGFFSRRLSDDGPLKNSKKVVCKVEHLFRRKRLSTGAGMCPRRAHVYLRLLQATDGHGCSQRNGSSGLRFAAKRG
jgi:hypothetical protein